jgi:hypothetical protein
MAMSQNRSPKQVHSPKHGFAVRFSGKLSLVTANFEDKVLPPPAPRAAAPSSRAVIPGAVASGTRELGGREGPEPTRFGDWELRGRCIDF